MGRPNNQAACTKFGKLINGQGAIRAGRVSDFSEINKQACPFIRQVRACSSIVVVITLTPILHTSRNDSKSHKHTPGVL